VDRGTDGLRGLEWVAIDEYLDVRTNVEMGGRAALKATVRLGGGGDFYLGLIIFVTGILIPNN
jgi:hypothetical protein